jgi:hypothetical protein
MRMPKGVIREASWPAVTSAHGRDQAALKPTGGVDRSLVDGHLHGHGAVRRRDLLQADRTAL